MNNKMIKALLIIVGLTVAVHSACSGNNELEGLVTGSASFAVATSTASTATSVFSHRFAKTLSRTPSVAIGIWDANFASSSSIPFGEFAVRAKDTTASGLTLEFVHSPSVWRSIRVNFWANTRDDISTGTFQTSLNSLRGSSSQQTVAISKIANYQKSIARALLNGFAITADSKALQLQIEPRSIQQTSVVFAVTVGSQTALNSVSFSYLVFSPTSLPFNSYGGVVSKSGYSGTSYKDLTNSVVSPDYVLLGLARLSSSLSLGLSSNIDEDFVFGVQQQGNAADFTYSYIVFGPTIKSTCSKCSDKSVFEGSCVASCPAGTYPYTFKDGGVGCRKCSVKLNQVLSADGSACGCAPGSEEKDDVCVGPVATFVSAVSSSSSSSSSSSASQQAGTITVNSPPAATTTATTTTQTTTTQAVPTNSMSTSGDFASLGVAQSGNSINSISANSNGVSSLNSNFKAIISITSGGSSSSGSGAAVISSPTSAVKPQVVNKPTTGGATVISSTPVDPNANSYVPTAPIQSPVAPTPTPTPSTPSNQVRADTATNASSCVNFPFTYWTGYRCACRVGYKMESVRGQCVKISIINTQPVVPFPQNCRDNEVFAFNQCVCAQGFTRDSSGLCVRNVVCAENSFWSDGQCVCETGYKKQGDYCVPDNKVCGQNSYHNGVTCVCNIGYVSDNLGKCVLGDGCPAFSEKRGGVCQCIQNYIEVRPGVCSRCPDGAIYLFGECTYTCGTNQRYDETKKGCLCNEGFGWSWGGSCSRCDLGFFLYNGYCVTCPLYSSYNSQTGRCDCEVGTELSSGRCVSKCRANQEYDLVSNSCQCLGGLAVLENGECGVCPANFVIDSATRKCVPQCLTGQTLQGGKCVCQTGLGVTVAGVCANCESVGAYLLNGYCVTCPNDRIWSGAKCVCPAGQTEQDGVCKSNCRSSQLVDSNGNCYDCPLNEYVKDGQCVCNSGLVRDPVSLVCLVKCPADFYIISGVCGKCVLGTKYDANLRQCVCPEGTYSNNYGYCEPRIIVCASGTYASSSTTCAPCPAGCSACTSATACTSCSGSFALKNGVCSQSKCGNGFIDAGEGCDDNNLQSFDGCSSSCNIQSGYQCSGSPSLCKKTAVPCGNGLPDAGEKCDDGNFFSGDGCSNACQIETGYICTLATPTRPSQCVIYNNSTDNHSKGLTPSIPMVNSKNVFVILTTDKAFTFANTAEMTSFIKYEFPPSYAPTSGYCRQKEPSSKTFNCLFNYASIPTEVYTISFSYEKDGETGFTEAIVNPKRTQFATRSLR